MFWQQQQPTVAMQGAALPNPRTSHIFQDYGNQGHHSGQLTANAQQTTKDHIHGFNPMDHKIIHENKCKMDSGAVKQQEVEGHAGDGLHLMRPLIDPITGQEMVEGTQTQETGDALYNFAGNFAGASAGAQSTGKLSMMGLIALGCLALTTTLGLSCLALTTTLGLSCLALTTTLGLSLLRGSALVHSNSKIDTLALLSLRPGTWNLVFSAHVEGQGSSNTGLKEAMECHYGDCKCIKQESHGEGSTPKPCSGKHCNCTCKTHKIVMATKKDNAGKIHKCSHCDFTSKRSDNVKRHMLRHTGERPHKCPHCDFSAKRPHSLKKHIENIHSKDLRGHELVESIHNKDLRPHGMVEDIHNKDLRPDGIVR
ncbi:Zinc finger autosomal protein [Chionoecetes opilio]|uniref:Zinc finger autosomal protein n=1 Tax=Chionoecetes opilio TaxID=41210 RepID=A0A8J4YNQ6_CHIOP|nr:Zinc finger autosomal protein [Chionoecetes opilio]